MSRIGRLFLDHPAAVNETYVEHLFFAFKFSARLFRIGLAALIHGVIPCLHETTASSEVLALSEEIRSRRRLMAVPKARLADSKQA